MNAPVLNTDRLRIYPSTSAEMEMLIRRQTDAELKTAYQEILNGALQNPIEWNWYAIWMIELKNGTHIGDLNFKGITADGMVEIGYVIQEEQQRKDSMRPLIEKDMSETEKILTIR